MNILEILGNLGFDWRMALANLANFLIIFWLLKKYAFKPINKKLKERDEKINQGLEDAKKAASEVVMAKENYEKKINEAKKEANLIIARATQNGCDIVKKSSNEAEEKANNIIINAKEIIQKEKEKMMQEIKKETVDIAIEITEKIIKEKLDIKKDHNLIEKLTK